MASFHSTKIKDSSSCRSRGQIGILGGLLALLVGTIIILSCVPPVSRDALTHHLAVPKLYLKHGGIYQIPSIEFSYYPMNLDLLYLVPLYFGNDIAPKFIHFIFAMLTAGLIFRYLKKRIDSVWGLLGALFFLSLPIIVKLSITVYVDLGLVFFSTAAIMSLFKWIDKQFELKYLVLSGVYCGLALGTKYNGLLVLFILTLIIPFVLLQAARRQPESGKTQNQTSIVGSQFKAMRSCVAFCAIALLVFFPWMARNYVWKGNPVYPLYRSFFSHLNNLSDNDQAEGADSEFLPGNGNPPDKASTRWGPLAIRKVIYDESWLEIALIPLRIFYQGQDDSPKHFDGKLSPFLLLLPLFAFFQIRNNPESLKTEKKILAAFSALYVLYAFLQIDMRIRYLAPIIPPAVILSIFGLHQITSGLACRWQKTSSWFASACILLLVSGLLIYNGSYIIEQFNYVRPFSYLSGKLNRDEYIARYRPEYKVIQYINRNLPESSKILTLFLGNRTYYCDREIISGNELFKSIIKSGESPAYIREEMWNRGITHLFIRYDLFNFWAEKQFADREKAVMVAFFQSYLLRVRSRDGYGLFQLSQDGLPEDGLRTK